PQPQTCHESSAARVFASGFGKVGGLSPRVPPGHADVRSDFASEFVAKPESEIGRAEAGSNAPVWIRLPEDFCFEERLQDEPVRKQELVLNLEASLCSAGGTYVPSCLDLEPVGCKSLNAEGGPRLR